MEKTMYRANGYISNSIETVKVHRETEKFVFFYRKGAGRERREAKVSAHQNYFNTWAEARDYLVELNKGKLEQAKARVNYAEEQLRKVEALRPTDCGEFG